MGGRSEFPRSNVFRISPQYLIQNMDNPSIVATLVIFPRPINHHIHAAHVINRLSSKRSRGQFIQGRRVSVIPTEIIGINPTDVMFQGAVIASEMPQSCQARRKFNLVSNLRWNITKIHHAQGLIVHKLNSIALLTKKNLYLLFAKHGPIVTTNKILRLGEL